MAVFHAFRALRPTPEKAADVAALPYDVVNREEAKSIGDENPLSFLHIDRPEMDLEPETDLYDDRVYEKAKENLDNMEEKGILVQDQKACYYIYELVRKGKTQTGIVGCSSIDVYMNGVVKIHELTREDKEQVMGQFLESLEEMPPQDMAERILRFACQNGGMQDDMTVLAAGIWKR